MQLSCLLTFLQAFFPCGDPSLPPELQAGNPPAEQIEFCGIIDDNSDQYRPLYEQAKQEPNGTNQDRLTAQMTDLFRARNQAVMDSVQPRHFHIEDWSMRIDKIARYAQDGDSGSGSGTVIELNLNANCRTHTTLQVDVPDGTPLAATLGDRKAGDPLAITGSFVTHYTETTPPVRALEWSVTPNRSMITPEYHIEVTRFGPKPATS